MHFWHKMLSVVTSIQIVILMQLQANKQNTLMIHLMSSPQWMIGTMKYVQLCFTFLLMELITHHDLCQILAIYNQKICGYATMICQPKLFGKYFHLPLLEFRKKMVCQILMDSYRHLMMFITSKLAAIVLLYLLYNQLLKAYMLTISKFLFYMTSLLVDKTI